MTLDLTKVDKNIVRIEYDNGVAWVTLNRPEKRNALNPAISLRMLEVLDEVEADDRCGVMVLTGGGDDAVSAGAGRRALDPDSQEEHAAARLGRRV